MSQLSPEECQAGISRSALATIAGRNGHRRQKHVPDAPQPATSVNNKAPVPELTHILLSHERQLDLINVDGWNFRLRKTFWQMNEVDNTVIYFTRPELEKLQATITQVLEKAGPRAQE